MNNKAEIKEKHLKIKAWNEYTIDYYALRIEKRLEVDYFSIMIFQGRFAVYQDIVYQSRKAAPIEMHQRLYHFLNLYRLTIKPFGIVYEDANFKPPEI